MCERIVTVETSRTNMIPIVSSGERRSSLARTVILSEISEMLASNGGGIDI